MWIYCREAPNSTPVLSLQRGVCRENVTPTDLVVRSAMKANEDAVVVPSVKAGIIREQQKTKEGFLPPLKEEFQRTEASFTGFEKRAYLRDKGGTLPAAFRF